MKEYKITYTTETTIIVEASSEEAAFNKAQETSMKIADADKVFLKPLDKKITVTEIEEHQN